MKKHILISLNSTNTYDVFISYSDVIDSNIEKVAENIAPEDINAALYLFMKEKYSLLGSKYAESRNTNKD